MNAARIGLPLCLDGPKDDKDNAAQVLIKINGINTSQVVKTAASAELLLQPQCGT